MRYISIPEYTDLRAEDLLSLTEQDLIRVEKLLVSAMKTEQLSPELTDDVTQILEAIHNPKTAQYLYFIEKHSWLKDLLSGKSKISSLLTLDKELAEQYTGISHFLEPYLQAQFFPYTSRALDNGEVEVLIHVMENKKYLMSETSELEFLDLLENKLDLAQTVVGQKPKRKGYRTIPYYTKTSFLRVINTTWGYRGPELKEKYYDVLTSMGVASALALKLKLFLNYFFRVQGSRRQVFINRGLILLLLGLELFAYSILGLFFGLILAIVLGLLFLLIKFPVKFIGATVIILILIGKFSKD